MFTVMALIFLLDATLDRKSVQNDPFKIMNAVIDFQTATVNKLLELFEQLRNIEPSSQKDELIKVEVTKI